MAEDRTSDSFERLLAKLEILLQRLNSLHGATNSSKETMPQSCQVQGEIVTQEEIDDSKSLDMVAAELYTNEMMATPLQEEIGASESLDLEDSESDTKEIHPSDTKILDRSQEESDASETLDVDVSDSVMEEIEASESESWSESGPTSKTLLTRSDDVESLQVHLQITIPVVNCQVFDEMPLRNRVQSVHLNAASPMIVADLHKSQHQTSLEESHIITSIVERRRKEVVNIASKRILNSTFNPLMLRKPANSKLPMGMSSTVLQPCRFDVSTTVPPEPPDPNHKDMIVARQVFDEREMPEDTIADATATDRGLLRKFRMPFDLDIASLLISQARIRQHLGSYAFFYECKVVLVSVYGNLRVNITGIQQDFRFIPPDNLVISCDSENLGKDESAPTTCLKKRRYEMLNQSASYIHCKAYVDGQQECSLPKMSYSRHLESLNKDRFTLTLCKIGTIATVEVVAPKVGIKWNYSDNVTGVVKGQQLCSTTSIVVNRLMGLTGGSSSHDIADDLLVQHGENGNVILVRLDIDEAGIVYIKEWFPLNVSKTLFKRFGGLVAITTSGQAMQIIGDLTCLLIIPNTCTGENTWEQDVEPDLGAYHDTIPWVQIVATGTSYFVHIKIQALLFVIYEMVEDTGALFHSFGQYTLLNFLATCTLQQIYQIGSIKIGMQPKDPMILNGTTSNDYDGNGSRNTVISVAHCGVEGDPLALLVYVGSCFCFSMLDIMLNLPELQENDSMDEINACKYTTCLYVHMVLLEWYSTILIKELCSVVVGIDKRISIERPAPLAGTLAVKPMCVALLYCIVGMVANFTVIVEDSEGYAIGDVMVGNLLEVVGISKGLLINQVIIWAIPLPPKPPDPYQAHFPSHLNGCYHEETMEIVRVIFSGAIGFVAVSKDLILAIKLSFTRLTNWCVKLFSPIVIGCIQCQARADLILVLAGYCKKVAGINFFGNLKWYEVVGRWNTAIRIIVAYLRIVEIASGPHHHIAFQLFKVEHSPSLPLVIILKTWTSMGGNSQVTQILELLGHLSIVTSMWANSVGELEMQAVAFSDFPDGFRLQSAQGLGADMYTFKSEDMQQQVMGAMNMHVGEVVEFFFKAGHDTKQLAEILSANCSLQFKQWDPGGYSLVHKQGSRDLEAIYQYATITHQYYLDFNLEDKVGFKGEGNVMNRLMSQHNVVPILNLKGWKMGKWRHI